MIKFVFMNQKIKNWIRLITILAIAVLCYTAFFQTMYCWMLFGDPIYDFTFLELLYSLWINYIPILLLAISIMLICFQTRGIKKHWLKMMIDGIAGATVLIIINLVFPVVTGMAVNWGGSIFNGVLVWLGIEYWSLSKQKRDGLIRENLLYQDNMRMKYEILQSYVNPHFLYNSLDMLCALIEDDEKDRAEKFILNLSGYYRQMTRRMNVTVTTFSEEIETVRRYLNIVNYHYQNCIELIVNCTMKDSDVQLIPFSLQLLVENVLKHNLISKTKPMKIVISITDQYISVSNKISFKPKTLKRASTGLGLSYLNTLYSCHGSEVKVEEKEGYFTVALPKTINNNLTRCS